MSKPCPHLKQIHVVTLACQRAIAISGYKSLSGSVLLNGKLLRQCAAAVVKTRVLALVGEAKADVLMFDLA